MPVPDSRNARIAIAKGWRREPYDDNRFHEQPFYWVDGANVVRGEQVPDWVGTLAGIAGLMRKLQEDQHRKEKALRFPPILLLHWSWEYAPQEKVHHCTLRNQSCYRHATFESPNDRPGDCVGDAYLSVFGKAELRPVQELSEDETEIIHRLYSGDYDGMTIRELREGVTGKETTDASEP